MTLEKSDVWVNLSKNEKGFTLKITEPGFYTGAFATLDKLRNKEIKGMTLSKIIADPNYKPQPKK